MSRHDNARYQEDTKERFRMNTPKDWHRIGESKQPEFDLLGAIHDHLLKHTWLRLTYHLRTRLSNYINQPSRDGSYIELYRDEYDHIQNIHSWYDQMICCWQYETVQLGWNDRKEICK